MKSTEGVGGWFLSAPETCLVKKHYTQCDLAMSDLLKFEVAPRFSPSSEKWYDINGSKPSTEIQSSSANKNSTPDPDPTSGLRNWPQTYRNTVIPIKPCGRGSFTNLAESLPIQILQVWGASFESWFFLQHDIWDTRIQLLNDSIGCDAPFEIYETCGHSKSMKLIFTNLTTLEE